MINITKVNPCRPFGGMSRISDFEEMLTDALGRGFGLSHMSGLLVDEAIHKAFRNNKSGTVIMRDIINEIWELRVRYGEAPAFELCAVFNCMIDDSYIEFEIFNDKDGVALNDLNVDQIKSLYRHTSNSGARKFIENMILYSFMF